MVREGVFDYILIGIRMLRKLQLSCLWRISNTPVGEGASPNVTTVGDYLLFPTSFPIAPYYFYRAKINRHLYDYIHKHKIRYVAAFPVRPGVYPWPFYPHDSDHFEN